MKPTISEQTFSSALELEQALVEAASSGNLVLTSTARLSRRVLHCYRPGLKAWDVGPFARELAYGSCHPI